MSYIDDLSKGIDKAYAEKDYEVVEILTERLRQEVGKGGGGGAGFLKNVATGLASGAIGMYESAALGGAALLEEEEELKAREKIQSVASSFRPDGGDKDSLTYKLSSGLGSIGALLPTALLGPAALPAAAAIAGGAGAGEASERARDFGATEEERSSATFRGSLIGLTEIAPLGRIAKGLQIPGVAKVLKKVDANDLKGIKNRIRSVATTGVAEGAQEAAAAILQNLNARGYDAEAELIDAGVLDEATIGGGAGAIIQALADVLVRGRARTVEGGEAPDITDEEAVEIAGLLPAPSDDIVVSSTGEAGTSAQQDEARRTRDDAQREREAEDETTLGDMPRAAVRRPTEQRDLFAEELEKAEKEATRASKGISDAEMTDAMAEQDAEKERAKRVEDDDQIKEQPDMVDEAGYDAFQAKQIKERTAAEDIELAEMQRQEDAAKEADDLEVERMVIADENKTAQSELEAQVKERKPRDMQQQPLTGIQSKTDAKKRGARRSAVETGDIDSVAREQATAEAIAELKGITVEEATQSIKPKAPDAEAVALLAENNIPLQVDTSASASQVDGISKDTATLVKKLTGKKVPVVKDAPKTKTDMQNKLETVGFTPSSTAKTGEVSSPTDTSSQEAAPADIGGDIEFATAVPRGTEFTNPDDVTAINTLLNKKIPRDEKGIEQTAQTYLKRFKRPADAFEAIAFEIADKTPKFRTQKGTPTSEVVKFEGTGGANTKATLQWAEKNLSPDAKAEIDKRVVEQIASKKERKKLDDQRATKSADEVLTTRRDTKAAIDVDTATGGKAKVVGKSTPSKATPKAEPSPTARADKAAKKEDIVKDAVEKVQGKAKTKPPLSDDMSPDQLRERLASDTAKYIAGGGKIDVLNLELDPKVAIELDAKLPTDVKALLKKGDLKGALQSLSKGSKNKRIKQIARALSENTGTTKIELANEASLKDKGYDIGDKSDVAGMFDPRINTILLNSNLPLTVHALLHEATHASTINQLKNKSHPATKQLNKLYQDVKPYLDSVYGAENLNEFIAEAFSNPVFQRKLASINPKGEEISVLQRLFRTVTNYVRRLIGMDTKPMGSALDEADAAIIAMLSPNSRTRDSAVMNMMSSPANVKKVLNDMASVQKSLIAGPKKAFIDGAVEFLGDAGINGKAKEVLLKLTGSQALGDIARGVGFGQVGIKLHAAYETMRGNIQTADRKIKESLDGYDAWAKDAGRDQVELLDNIVYSDEYGATIYQVDPTKPRSHYEKQDNQFDSSGNDLLPVYDKLQVQWNKLKPAGKKMFNSQRAEYRRLHEELVKVINGEIDALEANIDPNDKEAVKAFKDKQFSLKKQINQKLLEAGELEVYFPLVRQGKYKLSFDTTIKNKDGTTRVEPVFLMFDRKIDRDNMLAEVEADTNTVGDPDAYNGDTKRSSFNNAPAGSFVSDVLAVVNASMPKGKQSTETQEQIMRLFIESLPETSFAKSLQKRKGIRGYDKNVRGAMNNKGYSLSSQIEKMKSSALIRTLEKEVRDIKRPKDVNLDTFNRVKDELFVRSQFARTGATNKTTERLAQRSNQLAFIYTIGFNASSALVNLSQIPLVVGPFLSGKFGYAETSAAIAKAGKFVGASKLSIDEYYDIKDGTYTLKDSVEKKLRAANPNKKDADAAVAEYKRMIPMVKAANERGQVYHSEIKDQLRAGQGTSKNPALKLLDMVSSASAVMFSTAERFNRQTTLTMSYNLALDKLDALDTSNKKGKKERYYSAVDAKFIDVPTSSEARMDFAAKEALYLTQEVNGGSVLETAAGYSQQGLGRVALMYKSYGLQMYYSMLKAGKMYIDNRGGTDAESVQLRKMARNQLLGIHGSALFFAGAQGVPLYGAIAMIADLFFLDDEEDDFDTAVRKHIGEGWYKGAVTELTGVDIAGRVRLTGLLLQENRFNKDASLEENLAFYLGGPALSTANRLYRGVSDLRSGDIGSVERGIESLAPAGLTNAWRSSFGRYAREGGIRTRRGDPIYDDMTTGDFAAQALGFPPAEYTFIQERTARNKGIEKAIVTNRSSLTKKFYIANRMGDHETMGEVLKDIVAHNSRHPTAAINPEQVMKSVKSHMATSAKMHNGVTVNPIMAYAIQKSNMEYNQ